MRIQNDPGDQEELPKALLTAVDVETQTTSCHTPSAGIPKKGGGCSLFLPALTGKSTWLGHPPKPGLRREMSSTPGTTPVLSLSATSCLPSPPPEREKWKGRSCPTLRKPHGLYSLWNSPGQNTGASSLSLLQGDLPDPRIEPRSPALQTGSFPGEPPGKPKNTGVGSLSVLQGVFLTQESNQGLLCCRGILYQLSYKRSPIPLLPPRPLSRSLLSLHRLLPKRSLSLR